MSFPRRLGLVLGGLLLLASSACTGTSESTSPYLLVVGLDDPAATPAGPQVALVEDLYSPIAAVTDRFDLLASSRRALSYPAVAADVTHRAGRRDTLVLLTRDLGGGGAPASELRFFGLAGIDPLDPTAFSESRPAIALTGAGGSLEGIAGVGGSPCPVGVQVSRDGSQVAILDVRAACGGSIGEPSYLYLLDTDTSDARLVSTTGPLLPTAPYLDQADTEEHLYYLAEGVTNAQLYRLTLPDGTGGAYRGLTLPGLSQLALNAAAGSLIALRPSQVQSLDPVAGTGVATVPTVGSAFSLAVDATGATDQLVVLGGSQVAVHADPSDAQPEKLDITGRAAAIDPINRFGYVVRDGVITVIDLLRTGTSANDGRYRAFPVDGVVLPEDADGDPVGVLEWSRVAAAP